MDIIHTAMPKQTDRVWDQDVPIMRKGNYTHVYLTGEISHPFVYDELCYLLQEAEQHETFVFHLTTPGGDLDSAVRILDAMHSSQAYIVGNLAGGVDSAGTMITMGCDDIRIAPHTSFMIHYYSARIEGSGHELKKRQNFMNGLLENMMYDIYKNFLTVDEIDQTIKGDTFWMDAREVMARWEKRQEARFYGLCDNETVPETVTLEDCYV